MAIEETKLADRMSGLLESATLALNAKAKLLAAQGQTIYNLTAGELDVETPEYIQTFVAQNLHLNKYTPVGGLLELRQQIAKTAAKFYGLSSITPANVVVTAGAKPALFGCMMTLVNRGDEVIVPIPAWGSYFKLIELCGGIVVEVPLTDNFQLDVPAIVAKITPRTKAIIINSPHNPTGTVFSKSNLFGLAEVLKGSNITVIADDIYAKLVYDKDFTPTPKVGFEKLIIVNGFSKNQALTGWRIGYAIASEKIIKAIINLQSHTMGNAAVLSQQAAMAALQEGDRPSAELLASLKRRRKMVMRALDKIASIAYLPPSGAFYVFLDLRQLTQNSAKWCDDLLDKTGVALVPGEAFEAPGFCRLTFAANDNTLKNALARIQDFATKGSQ